VILNGIEDFVRRPDLVDRCLYLTLDTIPEDRWRTEAEFWESFEQAHADILGAILAAVAGGLRLHDTVKLERLPRMADFARWGEAVWRALGEAPGAFVDVYQTNRQAATEATLEDNLVAIALRALMTSTVEWTGTAAELLRELNTDRVPHPEDKLRWPRSARALSGHLRRLAPALRAVGVNVMLGTGRRRELTIAAERNGDMPCQPCQPCHEAENKANECHGRENGDAQPCHQPCHGREDGDTVASDQPCHDAQPPEAAGHGCHGRHGQSPPPSADREELEL
jgi:hypothetical protein